MDREQVKRLVERLRQVYRAEWKTPVHHSNVRNLLKEATDTLEQSVWPPSREQIARVIDPTAFTEWTTPPRGLEMASTAILAAEQGRRRNRAFKHADAILAFKPEKPNVV